MEMSPIMSMRWSDYRLEIENVAAEDGGGFRIFYPTLGFAVYGVGDSITEALLGFEESKAAYLDFMAENPEYCPPCPTAQDLLSKECGEVTSEDFAYAA